MAWTFRFVAGTSTLDLNDGTNYQVNVNGFHAPPPTILTSYAGPNLFRHGADLVERSYGNRTVTIGLEIKGTNASTLGAQVQNIWDYLRRAEEFSRDGLGTQVQFRYQWEGATGTYLFDIIEGRLDLGANLHSPYLLKGTRARNAQLVLEAKPFVTQPGETIRNLVDDPSFEIAATALTDWAVGTSNMASSTLIRTTAGSKYGTASLEISGSSTGASTATASRSNVMDVAIASGGTYSASVWVNPIALAGFKAEMILRFSNATGTNQSAATSTATGTSFVKMSITTATATASGTATIVLSLTGISGTGSGTVRFDGVLVQTGTLPTAWISGGTVGGHFDDTAQGHINYLDIFDIPGDMPAPAQVRVLEAEAHDQIWVGARHDTRATGTGLIVEAESFTGTIGVWNTTADSNFSNGSLGRVNSATTSYGSMTATAPGTPQVIMYNIGTPPVGQFRVLLRGQADTATNGTLFFGVGYQYGGRTVDPSTTSEYQAIDSTAASGTVQKTYDLGVLRIPPFQTPEGATIGTFGLRIAFYASSATINSPRLDYVMLMPINEGGVYGTKTSAIDNLWIDSRSQPAGIYRVTTADVAQEFLPNQVGLPPLLHPKGTRLYFNYGTGTAGGAQGQAQVSVSYVPRYLHVGT